MRTPALPSLEDPKLSRSKGGQPKHGLLGPVSSGSALVLRSGQVDWKEGAAVDMGSTLGHGGVSGQQI